MNLKINRESVRSVEKICDCTQEQPLELDYVLPDYYPEIFRVIRCTAEPKITSCTASGDRITYELTVSIRVIYCSENAQKPESIEQKLNYSRTVNLDSPSENISVYIRPSTDHITCRAVNRRRIDIRGAVSMKITAYGEHTAEVIDNVFGGSVQLKKTSCICPSAMIRTQKRVTVTDELELPEGAPSVGSILRADAQIVTSDKKIIAGKAAAKGELKISVLYTPSADVSDQPVSSVQFSMPFSQLIDLDGMDDSFDCRLTSEAVSCEVRTHSDGTGDIRTLECETLVFIDCTAVKMSAYDIASDEYSTAYASAHTSIPVKVEKTPETVDNVMVVKGVCENKDSPLSAIYDVWCCTDKLRCETVNGNITVTGNVRLYIMGKAENGDFVICDTDIPVEEVIGQSESDTDIRLSFPVLSCSYTISSENKAEIKAEIGIRGWISHHEIINAITDITVDETSERQKNDEYALRLYFAESGEDIWNIAKSYGAAMDRVCEENDLDGASVKENRMLLIPME